MGCINGKCDTCERPMNYDEIKAHDDVCEECYFTYGIFDDEVSE